VRLTTKKSPNFQFLFFFLFIYLFLFGSLSLWAFFLGSQQDVTALNPIPSTTLRNHTTWSCTSTAICLRLDLFRSHSRSHFQRSHKSPEANPNLTCLTLVCSCRKRKDRPDRGLNLGLPKSSKGALSLRYPASSWRNHQLQQFLLVG